MSHKTISTYRAPAAAGAYSQACIAGKLLFVSGQIPVVPVSGELIKGDIERATRQCMDNLLAIVEAAHSDAHLVKVTIYLTDMGNFADVNSAYASYFEIDPPARVCVEVSRLPKGAEIEIDGIAILPE